MTDNTISLEMGTPTTSPPPAKEGWNHSEQCLVWYEGENREGGNSAGWGIAYYHYNPPFHQPGWTNFERSGTPVLWWPLPSRDAMKTDAERLDRMVRE